MQTYTAPLRDMRFVLHELHDSSRPDSPWRVSKMYHPDLIDSILEEAAKLTDVLLPLNASGDADRLPLDNGVVRTPAGFKEAYEAFRRGRLEALSADPEYGGQGLPESVNKLVEEMICSANLSFSLYPGLTHGAFWRSKPRLRRAEGPVPAEDGGRHLVRHDVPDRVALRHRSRDVAHQGGAAGRRQLPHQRIEDLHQCRRA